MHIVQKRIVYIVNLITHAHPEKQRFLFATL